MIVRAGTGWAWASAELHASGDCRQKVVQARAVARKGGGARLGDVRKTQTANFGRQSGAPGCREVDVRKASPATGSVLTAGASSLPISFGNALHSTFPGVSVLFKWAAAAGRTGWTARHKSKLARQSHASGRGAPAKFRGTREQIVWSGTCMIAHASVQGACHSLSVFCLCAVS